MGEIAEMMLEGILDEQTGEYIGEPCGYPRTKQKRYYNSIPDTPSEKNIRKVRKELAILIKQKQNEYQNNNSNIIVDCCRRYINLKYGSGWRERGLYVNDENQWKEHLNQYKNPEFDWDYELTKHLTR
ncbi:MAG: hypothetical protein WC942_12330 [Clostridia bacterium]|jgi:hypothetical protein